MSIAASRLQQRRRDQERVLHETESFLSSYHNTTRLHDWENRTQKQIEEREVEAIAQRLKEEDEDELRRRKQDLQSLYRTEMEGWKETLQSTLEETQEERMEKIRARAYELKEKREAERQAFVKECYERQWADACDDLRAYESKATLDRLNRDRQMMIKTKRVGEERHQPSESMDAMCLIQKDEDEGRSTSSREFRQALDHQVHMKKSQAALARQQELHEQEEQLRQLAVLEQKAREAEKAAVEERRREGREMLAETMQRKKDRNEQAARARQQNLLLLQHNLDMERAQLQAEAAKRDAGKRTVHECPSEKGRDEEEENVFHQHELDRLARRNDEKMNADIERRKAASHAIHESRQEQIRRKQLEEEDLRRDRELEAAEIERALRKAEEDENAEALKAQQAREAISQANKETIDQRSREREKVRQSKHLLQKRLQDEQQEYQERLLAVQKKSILS